MAPAWMPVFGLDYYLGSGWRTLQDEALCCLRIALRPCPMPIPAPEIEAFVTPWVVRACEVAEERRRVGRNVSQYVSQALFHERTGVQGLQKRLQHSPTTAFIHQALLHHASYWLQDRRRELLWSECGHSEHQLKTWSKIRRVAKTRHPQWDGQWTTDLLITVMHELKMRPKTLLSYLCQFEPDVEFSEEHHGMQALTPLDLLESREAMALCEQCFAELPEREQWLLLTENGLSELEHKQRQAARRTLEQTIRRRLDASNESSDQR